MEIDAETDSAMLERLHDAFLSVHLLAVDPIGLGGAVVRAGPGPVRDAWIAGLRAALPAEVPVRRLPVQTSDDRLLGGLDLAETLRLGRPVVERGLLAEASGGVLLAAMAERMAPSTAAHIATVLDTGVLVTERDGIAARMPAQLCVVALDEGLDEEERLPSALLDRLAFQIDLSAAALRAVEDAAPSAVDVTAARALLARVTAGPDILEALCATALALGIDSLRASLQAVRVARTVAALDGRTEVVQDDAIIASRLVLAPRATRIPAPPEAEAEAEDAEPPPPEPEPSPDDPGETDQDDAIDQQNMADIVLAAAAAALPPGLRALLAAGAARGRARRTAGKGGPAHKRALRGRPVGAMPGDPRRGRRLNVVETLRVAAPWQAFRRAESGRTDASRLEIRRDDFRISRYKFRSAAVTIFVVDASGSAALSRLAEAKGAVELLLAECYTRRDQVALIAFRRKSAEVILPPTRSLARGKRLLTALPGGGGTPLAGALDAALALADAVRRKDQDPTIVFLTDGQANIARDGSPGRAKAEEDALASAQALRLAGVTCLLIDTAPRPRPQAERLAREMAGFYIPLPQANAQAVSQAVRAVIRPGR